MLVVKKVLFTKMGSGAKTLKARVVGWLCTDCTKKDPDFNREAYIPIDEKEMIRG